MLPLVGYWVMLYTRPLGGVGLTIYVVIIFSQLRRETRIEREVK